VTGFTYRMVKCKSEDFCIILLGSQAFISHRNFVRPCYVAGEFASGYLNFRGRTSGRFPVLQY